MESLWDTNIRAANSSQSRYSRYLRARRIDGGAGACALIAIKERSRCKTRLASALTGPARLALVRSMLATVLAAASRARTVEKIIVVSPERDFVPLDVPVVADAGDSLNAALTRAYLMLRNCACRETIVLPADLPNIKADEIDLLVRAAREGGFALAPDMADTGTNAIALMCGQAFRFRFGSDSKRLHLEEAGRLGLAPKLVRLPGLQFDLDLPNDLTRLKEQRCPIREV